MRQYIIYVLRSIDAPRELKDLVSEGQRKRCNKYFKKFAGLESPKMEERDGYPETSLYHLLLCSDIAPGIALSSPTKGSNSIYYVASSWGKLVDFFLTVIKNLHGLDERVVFDYHEVSHIDDSESESESENEKKTYKVHIHRRQDDSCFIASARFIIGAEGSSSSIDVDNRDSALAHTIGFGGRTALEYVADQNSLSGWEVPKLFKPADLEAKLHGSERESFDREPMALTKLFLVEKSEKNLPLLRVHRETTSLDYDAFEYAMVVISPDGDNVEDYRFYRSNYHRSGVLDVRQEFTHRISITPYSETHYLLYCGFGYGQHEKSSVDMDALFTHLKGHGADDILWKRIIRATLHNVVSDVPDFEIEGSTWNDDDETKMIDFEDIPFGVTDFSSTSFSLRLSSLGQDTLGIRLEDNFERGVIVIGDASVAPVFILASGLRAGSLQGLQAFRIIRAIFDYNTDLPESSRMEIVDALEEFANVKMWLELRLKEPLHQNAIGGLGFVYLCLQYVLKGNFADHSAACSEQPTVSSVRFAFELDGYDKLESPSGGKITSVAKLNLKDMFPVTTFGGENGAVEHVQKELRRGRDQTIEDATLVLMRTAGASNGIREETGLESIEFRDGQTVNILSPRIRSLRGGNISESRTHRRKTTKQRSKSVRTSRDKKRNVKDNFL